MRLVGRGCKSVLFPRPVPFQLRADDRVECEKHSAEANPLLSSLNVIFRGNRVSSRTKDFGCRKRPLREIDTAAADKGTWAAQLKSRRLSVHSHSFKTERACSLPRGVSLDQEEEEDGWMSLVCNSDLPAR